MRISCAGEFGFCVFFIFGFSSGPLLSGPFVFRLCVENKGTDSTATAAGSEGGEGSEAKSNGSDEVNQHAGAGVARNDRDDRSGKRRKAKWEHQNQTTLRKRSIKGATLETEKGHTPRAADRDGNGKTSREQDCAGIQSRFRWMQPGKPRRGRKAASP